MGRARPRFPGLRGGLPKRSALAVLLCLCVGGAGRSGALDNEDGTAHVFRLSYKPAGFAHEIEVAHEDSEVVFKKEPQFVAKKVARGALPIGLGTEDYVCFAWDQAEGKLYIDHNRNLDLTDDPSGPYSAEYGGGSYASFTGIDLATTQADVSLAYAVDVELFSMYASSQQTVTVCSGWEGEMDLHGTRCRMAVVDNLDGRLGAGDAFFFGTIADVDAFEDGTFPVPEMLFFEDRAYEVETAFEPGEAGTDLVVTLTETAAELGELQIEGTLVRRVLLDGDVRLELNGPGKVVRIPTGTYAATRVALDAGLYAEAERAFSGAIVAADTPGTLKVGGPLTQRVKVHRSGNTLRLDHEGLTGIGGEAYGADRQGSPPSFVVYKGDKKVAAGTFEYG